MTETPASPTQVDLAPMRSLLWIVAVMLVLIAAACTLGEEPRRTLLDYFAQELAAGRITQAQFDTLREGLSGGDLWRDLLLEAVGTAVGIGGALLGVRQWRGPIHARKGSHPPPA